MRGRFITFEGIEGAGKSTQIDVFMDELARAGISAIKTREPGGTRKAERIREILKDPDGESVPPVAELLLMFAARAINTQNAIRPALAEGTWVIADRFTDSTRAYQGAGRGQSRKRIDRIARWVHGDTQPDLTVLLDVPVDVGLARAGRRGAADRFEKEETAFFSRVRDQYLELAASEPERIVVISAAAGVDDVSAAVRTLARDTIEHFNKNR